MRLVHPFKIGRWPTVDRLAFVLGYELGYCQAELKAGRGFDLSIHEENAERLNDAIRQAARSSTVYLADAGWVRFIVEPKE